MEKKFDLGQLVSTRRVADMAQENPDFQRELENILQRYTSYDWGDIDEEDSNLNDEAIDTGDRILAAYDTSLGKIFVITEADRSATTILFANEY